MRVGLNNDSTPQDFIDQWCFPARALYRQERSELAKVASSGFPTFFDGLYDLLKGQVKASDSFGYVDFASFCLRHDLRQVERELAERVYARAALDPEFGFDNLCDNISFNDFERIRSVLLDRLPSYIVSKMETKILDEKAEVA